MTTEQFDEYKFSSQTQVKIGGEWHRVTEVLFEYREVWFNGCSVYRGINEIEDIREGL